MQSIRTRQLKASLSFDGAKFTTAKPWDLASGSTVNDAAIATEAYVTNAVHDHVAKWFCYVDSNRASETYPETGSETAQYRSLSSAITAKLADGQTDRVIFKLAPGHYTGTISRDKAVQEQVFEIHGSGAENTFIQGGTTWDATIGNVLYFRDFARINIQDCSICHGQYGLYTRDCLSVTVRNCRFYTLGSSGVNHGFNRTEAQMAADWASRGTAGSNRSNGGAMRIRAAPFVEVDNCEIRHTLRGVRIQDCGIGGSCRITNCRADSCLESAFYTAAGDYTGATGTENMFISNCRADNIFHHGFLCIGGANVTITSCQAVNCASSACVGWHCQDMRVVGCVFDECTSKTYIGIGVPGDNFGCIYYSCKEGLTSTGGYMLTAINNIMSRCGQGRAAAITGIYFGAFDTTVSSYRAIVDGNNMDAPTFVHKAYHDIPLMSTQFPQTVPLINANGAAIATNSGLITTNTTSIASNDVDIASLMTTTTANASGISGNDTDIAANVTALAGKQATLSWSTVEDNDQNPVTAEKIKTYVDASGGGGGDVYLANVNKFTANQEIKANSNVKLTLEHTGYGSPMQIANNYGDAGIVYVGKSAIKFNGNRIMLEGGCTLFQLPRVSTLDNTNAAHGCLVVDDSNGATALKLKFHNGSQWKNVTLS